ncbi:class A beta-lactamase [Sphingosinicella sp.]|uniref:class A beta-lactamase n=1 Tax=Sphingosinicella sp. TaxID=1917971 RepID=UPI002620205F|nr:class A beta-lactamase [Sphingosinicella sp.]
MSAAITRRLAVSGLAATALAACLPRRDAEGFAPRIAEIEAQSGGGIGLFVRDTGSGRTLAHRADERFAMASTFKAPLAAAVLARAEAGALRLDRPVPYTAAYLLAYAPVTARHVAEGAMSVEALCAATVELSDNTAANLLLPLVGGPAGLTRWLRGLGDSETRLDRTEPTLNTNIPGDPRDTTTPRAMAGTLEKLLLTDAMLTPAARARLTGWMVASPTGKDRLRAGLPADWRVADKTGTGMNGAANIIAVLWPPAAAPLVAAVYMTGSKAPVPQLNTAHAALGRAIAAWQNP